MYVDAWFLSIYTLGNCNKHGGEKGRGLRGGLMTELKLDEYSGTISLPE